MIQLLRKLFWVEQWCIGTGECAAASLMDDGQLPEIHWWPRRSRSAFAADPFFLDADTVAFEHMSRWRGRAEIRLAAADGSASRRLLKRPWHLSFPASFEADGQRFLMPEASESGKTSAYRLANGVPEEAFVIDQPLLDPVVFQSMSHYWLIATLPSDNAHREMFIWYSQKPAGPWREHALNPIPKPGADARNAGSVLRLAGVDYRPAQVCEQSYGEAIRFFRIEELTPTTYREVPVRDLEPDQLGVGWTGVHTINFSASRVLVDGRRPVFHPLAWLFKLRNRIFGWTAS